MTEKNFLGLPVEGQVYVPSDRRYPQLSEQEVNALFQAVLDRPEVLGVGWAQYTPYFNDGEPCVFGIGEPYIALDGVETKEEDHYFDYRWMEDDHEETGRVWLSTYNSSFKDVVGERKYNWAAGQRSHEDCPVNPDLYWPIMNLFNAVGGGRCNDVLLQKFGDHANVVIDVKAGKVIVEEYDHD